MRCASLTSLLIVVSSAFVVAACSSSTTTTASPPSSSSSAPDAGTAPIRKADLAGKCTFGCEPGVACATTSDSCPLGYCAFDGRPDSTPAAYCTAACNDNCPEGYTCESASHSSVRVCLAKPGKCGDGEIQGQESCDDGNALDFDACSKDCTQGAPTFRGDLRYGLQRSHAKLVAELPATAKSNGCDKVTVTEASGYLDIDATFCDPNTSERMRVHLDVKNVKGVAATTSADVDFVLGTVGGSTGEALSSSCGNCGVTLTVTDTWGSTAGFAVTIDAILRVPSNPNGVVVSVSGPIQIVPPADGG